MVIFGALESFPSRTMIESPSIFKASNHKCTLWPSGKVMTHVQLERPGRENSCGDDVIIPCGSVNRHPQEQADPETVRHVTGTVRELNSQKFGNTDMIIRRCFSLLKPQECPYEKETSLISLWDS